CGERALYGGRPDTVSKEPYRRFAEAGEPGGSKPPFATRLLHGTRPRLLGRGRSGEGDSAASRSRETGTERVHTEHSWERTNGSAPIPAGGSHVAPRHFPGSGGSGGVGNARLGSVATGQGGRSAYSLGARHRARSGNSRAAQQSGFGRVGDGRPGHSRARIPRGAPHSARRRGMALE